MIVLDGRQMQTRQTAFPYLRRKLDLSDWFGDNMEALYDALSTWSGDDEIELIGLGGKTKFLEELCGVLRDAENSNMRLCVHIFPEKD